MPVRALVGSEFDAVRLRDQGFEAVTADLVEGRGLDSAVRGVETVVYLADTLDREGVLVTSELETVQNTLLAARAAGARRVVFLGSVGASSESRARYLVARWAVELAVRQSQLRWVILRAPLIVGPGGTLFEVLRGVVARGPIVPLLAWRSTPVEPVALSDVVEALRMAARDSDLDGRAFDICGSERTTVGALLKSWARVSGRRRLHVPVPGSGERLVARLSALFLGKSAREVRLLLETLREPQLCTDPSARFPLPHRPSNVRQALAAVLEQERGAA